MVRSIRHTWPDSKHTANLPLLPTQSQIHHPEVKNLYLVEGENSAMVKAQSNLTFKLFSLILVNISGCLAMSQIMHCQSPPALNKYRSSKDQLLPSPYLKLVKNYLRLLMRRTCPSKRAVIPPVIRSHTTHNPSLYPTAKCVPEWFQAQTTASWASAGGSFKQHSINWGIWFSKGAV